MNLFKHHRPATLLAFLLVFSMACSSSEPGSEHAAAATSKSDPHGEEHGKEDRDHEEHGDHEEDGDHEEHAEGIVELSAEAASRVEIRTVPVERRVLAAELSTTGQVDFDQTRLAHVSPRISGRVHRVNAVLGQQVRAGQKLAEVDSIELGQAKAVFLQAKAREELGRKSFVRAEGLFADRIASEQEVLEAEAVLRESTAGLRTAEETLHLYGLSQTQIDTLSYEEREASIYPLRAPFAGTIVERHATLGELVTPERNLFTLADLSQVWIWIDVYQRDLAGVHVDDQARARVDAFPSDVFTGKVSYLSARVDTDTRTVRARVDVANPAGKLRPGMFVEVELQDPHTRQGREIQASSLVIPQNALVRDGDEFLVFVATGERRYERREIEIGRKAGGFVEVLPGDGGDSAEHGEGLQAGDLVVVEGAFLLKSAVSKDSLGGGHQH
jgi:cobalt-zinc-cadmium efflux system membrane fusion protein